MPASSLSTVDSQTPSHVGAISGDAVTGGEIYQISLFAQVEISVKSPPFR